MAEPSEGEGGWSRLGWVAAVVAIGAAVGGILWVTHPLTATAGQPPPPPGGPAGSTNLGRIAGVLSLVDLALLVALIVVYVRTYRDTKARFALGLVVFLLALTVQSATSSLPLIRALGFGFGALGGFFLVSTTFESLALAVFLYLSLE